MLIRRLQNLYTTGQAPPKLAICGSLPIWKGQGEPITAGGFSRMLRDFSTCNLCKTTVRISSQNPDLLGQEMTALCRENYSWPLLCTAKQWPARTNAWARWQGRKNVHVFQEQSYDVIWAVKGNQPQTESSMLYDAICFQAIFFGHFMRLSVVTLVEFHRFILKRTLPDSGSPDSVKQSLGKEVSQYILLLKLCMESNPCHMFIKFYHC